MPKMRIKLDEKGEARRQGTTSPTKRSSAGRRRRPTTIQDPQESKTMLSNASQLDSDEALRRCCLLELPFELRAVIWTDVLQSITVIFDELWCQSCNGYSNRPPHETCHSHYAHKLPFDQVNLRRICRQARIDTEDIWLKHVTLKMKLSYSLLRLFPTKSSPLSAYISQIKHLDVGATTMEFMDRSSASTRPYSHTWDTLLDMDKLPQLNLETLVLRTFVDELSWPRQRMIITRCVRSGTKWRRLIVLVSTVDVTLPPRERQVLAAYATTVLTEAKLDKEKWHRDIKERDGRDSDAGVEVFLQQGSYHLSSKVYKKAFREYSHNTNPRLNRWHAPSSDRHSNGIVIDIKRSTFADIRT